MPQLISATHARNNFSELLNLVAYKGAQFAIGKKGKPMAILHSFTDKTTDTCFPQPQIKAEKILKEIRQNSLKANWPKFKHLVADLHSTNTR